MKEHKKLYKAGKLWITATLFAFAGIILTTSPVSADSTNTQPTQTLTETPAPTTQSDQAGYNQSNSLSGQIQSAQQEVNAAQINYDNTVRNAPKTAGQGVQPIGFSNGSIDQFGEPNGPVPTSLNQLPLIPSNDIEGNINYQEEQDHTAKFTGTKGQVAQLTEYAELLINELAKQNGLQGVSTSQEGLNGALEYGFSKVAFDGKTSAEVNIQPFCQALENEGYRTSAIVNPDHGTRMSRYDGQYTMLAQAYGVYDTVRIQRQHIIDTLKQAKDDGEQYSIILFPDGTKLGMIFGNVEKQDPNNEWMKINTPGTPLANTGFVDSIRAAQAGASRPNLNDPSVINAKNRLNQAQAHLQQLLNAQTQQYKQNQGHLDSFQLTSQGLHVAGWHVAGASESQNHGYLLVLDNGREIKRVPITPVARPDVQRAYPAVANSYNSGFNQTIALPSASYGHNLQVIARYSSDAIGGEGQHTDFWFPVIKGDNSNNASLDGIQFKNGKLVVSGWHATNQAMGHPYHKIIAWDATKNREVSRTNVSQVTRADVARVYPGIVNAGQSGFTASFNLVPEFGNDDIQFISRYSSDPNCNTNCVDYWFGARKLTSDQSNRGWLDNVSVQGNKLHVAGWHATNQAMGRPYHSIIVLNANNGQELGRSTTSKLTNRPDLAQAMPGILTASQAGFSTDLNLTPAMVDQPIRIISRWSGSADANSNFVDYWFAPRTLFSDTNNYANLDDFSLHGNQIRVAGWNATNKSYGRNHHFIILFDKTSNREISRQEVTNPAYRRDVANAFASVYNAGRSGFNVNFANNNSLNGHQLQVLSRWTSDPSGNGDAVDYWFPAKTLNTTHSNASTNQPVTGNQHIQKAFNIDSLQLHHDNNYWIQGSGWLVSNAFANTNYKDWYAAFAAHYNPNDVRVCYAILLKNGKEIERESLHKPSEALADLIDRPDVAAKYPNIWDSLHSGFDLIFSSKEITPGANYQIILRVAKNQNTVNSIYDDMYTNVYHF